MDIPSHLDQVGGKIGKQNDRLTLNLLVLVFTGTRMKNKK